jgi:hypothetical protein
MFLESIRQRINEYNELRRKYNDTTVCPGELSTAIRATIVAITILVVIYVVLFILSVYYLFKCSIKKRWGIIVPVILLTLSLIPYYGGIITLGIVVYGMNTCGSICEVPSDITKPI